MAKVTEFGEHCVTSTSFVVRFYEVDLMGIVHHANYLKFVELGRVEYLRRRGAGYRALTERGIHLPVISAQLNFRAPARFEDVLTVEVRPTLLTGVRIEFAFEIRRAEQVLCDGRTLLACVDDDGRPQALSAELRQLVDSAELNNEQPTSGTLGG